MDNQPVGNQENEPSLDQLFASMMMTPEQEAEQLLKDFSEFAGSLADSAKFIPEDSPVKAKVERLSKALEDINKEDMLVLFVAMEKANPQDFPEDETLLHEEE